MTTPGAEQSSRDVSFIGSLLRLNSIGTNFHTNPFFQHPTGLSTVSRRPGVAGFNVGMGPSLLKPTTPASNLPPNDGDGDKEEPTQPSPDPMTPSSSPATTPRSISSNHATPRGPTLKSVAKEKEKHQSRKAEEHPPKKKEKPSVRSPSSSSVRAVEVKQENIKALSSPLIKHPRVRGCNCRSDNNMQIEPRDTRKPSSRLISNIYYAKPPPNLMEYRKRELVCYDKITDDLIDLTQSTIDMVQSMKKELRN